MRRNRPLIARLVSLATLALLLAAACAEMTPLGGPTDTGVQALGSDTDTGTPPPPPVSSPTTTTTLPEFDDPILETPIEPAPPVEKSPGFTYEFPPEVDEYVGWIRIPAANIDHQVIEGVARTQLDVSPGHMPRTAMPGQFGNAVIAGHRTTYGAPFYDLDLLAPGDDIFVDTAIGTHTYEVVSTEIVLPNAMWTVQHRAGGWLTLIACHPKGSNAQRIIVFAKLVGGPNHDAISAIYDGPYDPPTDPGTPVPRRHVREAEPTNRSF
jgi:LPXTG-site transpeptidase (sortase) family protein